MTSWDEAALIDELSGDPHTHTIVLYGSRARGDATPESDIDLAAFADVAEPTRDARRWRGFYLDGFVYPTAQVESTDLDLLKLLGGRVLLDDRGLAGPMLARLAELERRGPAPLRPDDAQMRRVWAEKTLARIRRDDVEARYRHHLLLVQLLEDYFALRTAWYRGPKLALAELRATAPDAFAAFDRALAPGAGIETLDALVAIVIR